MPRAWAGNCSSMSYRLVPAKAHHLHTCAEYLAIHCSIRGRTFVTAVEVRSLVLFLHVLYPNLGVFVPPCQVPRLAALRYGPVAPALESTELRSR